MTIDQVTIHLTKTHWHADLNTLGPYGGRYWGRYSGTREDVHWWLTHPLSRRLRWLDVIEGRDGDDEALRVWDELIPPMVQAIMVADVSGPSDEYAARLNPPEPQSRI